MTKTYSIMLTGPVYGFADSSHVSILVSGDPYERGVRLFAEGVEIKDAERLVDLLNRHPDMEVLANLVDLGLDVKAIEMEEDGPEDVPESEALRMSYDHFVKPPEIAGFELRVSDGRVINQDGIVDQEPVTRPVRNFFRRRGSK